MAPLRRVGGVYLHDSPSVGLNHVSGTPVDLTSEPSAMLHGVLDVRQILEGHDGVTISPGHISEILGNEDAQFLATVREVLAMRNGFL